MTNATGIKGKFFGQPMLDGGNFSGTANVYMPIYFKFSTCVAFIIEDITDFDMLTSSLYVDTTTANAYWISGMEQGEPYHWMAMGHG